MSKLNEIICETPLPAPTGLATFDTEYQDAPICPHCGHAQRDAWDINFGQGIEGDTEIDCGECEKTFMASRHCTITYSTQKLPNAGTQRRRDNPIT